ncbi:MAG: methyltransferase domain-containing protein [Burkholderiales bacterium]
MIALRLAKVLMQTLPARPEPPGEKVSDMQEVFRHERFLAAQPSHRAAYMLASSRSKYESELAYPWDAYFGIDLRPQLAGREALDLGCFTGGRGIAWYERYGLTRLTGVDVDQTFIDAGNQFARTRGVAADFQLARGEALPFEDDAFDAILSYDVLEHVRSVARTLAECHRVLKPGGRCYLVFPGYFQPVEHHLSLATRVPGIQCLFTGKTLVAAYCEILNDRGEDSRWYRRRSAALEPWERSNTLNGITQRGFRRILRESDWRVVLHSRKPIGSIGRNISRNRIVSYLANAFRPFTYVPGLQEFFLHRITYILEKPSAGTA